MNSRSTTSKLGSPCCGYEYILAYPRPFIHQLLPVFHPLLVLFVSQVGNSRTVLPEPSIRPFHLQKDLSFANRSANYKNFFSAYGSPFTPVIISPLPAAYFFIGREPAITCCTFMPLLRAPALYPAIPSPPSESLPVGCCEAHMAGIQFPIIGEHIPEIITGAGIYTAFFIFIMQLFQLWPLKVGS